MSFTASVLTHAGIVFVKPGAMKNVSSTSLGQQTLNAFSDLGDLPLSGIIVIDEKWISKGNRIFQFGCSAFDGITGRTILAEVYPTILYISYQEEHKKGISCAKIDEAFR